VERTDSLELIPCVRNKQQLNSAAAPRPVKLLYSRPAARDNSGGSRSGNDSGAYSPMCGYPNNGNSGPFAFAAKPSTDEEEEDEGAVDDEDEEEENERRRLQEEDDEAEFRLLMNTPASSYVPAGYIVLDHRGKLGGGLPNDYIPSSISSV
jgi:hypothetical protein